jgi:hypothetical protein
VGVEKIRSTLDELEHPTAGLPGPAPAGERSS